MGAMAKSVISQYSNRAWMKPHVFKLCSMKPTTNARFFRATTHANWQRPDVSPPSQYSVQKALQDFNPYAQAVGTIFGVMTVLFGTLAFVVNEIAKTKNGVELAKKDFELAKKNDEIIAYQARTAIAEHDAKMSNQFLLYGYAEEYSRFQKKTGVFKDGEASKDGTSSQ